VALESQPRLPLQGYRALETRSQSVAQRQNEMFVRTEALTAAGEDRDFRLTINGLSFDAFRLCAVGTTGHSIRLVDEENVATLIPLHETIEVDDGRHAVKAFPGDCIVTSPPRRLTTVSSNYVGLVLLASRQQLAKHLSNAGATRHATEVAALTSARHPSAGILGRYVRFLVQELDRSEALVRSALPMQAMSALLMDLVGNAFDAPDDGNARQRLAAAPWQVARAEAFMRQNVGQPLTMAAVTAELGTSLRALQLAFQRHHGVSPRAYLEACRLDTVRDRLAKAAPGTTVAATARACGVVHLGRFAARYNRKFGELPSETLYRAWRRL